LGLGLSGSLRAHLRTWLKRAPSSFRATRDVILSASHVAATALLHLKFGFRHKFWI